MNRVKEVLQTEKAAGRAGLIAFLMAAMPDQERCLEYVKALKKGGCDLLELGVPYSDPLADGELIQELHFKGLEKGLNLDECLKFAARVRSEVDMPVILFSYYNPIFRLGMPEFTRRCRESGIESAVIPDLPLELARELDTPVDIIPMVAPSTRPERMQLLNGLDPGFVYCVSVRGVTGVRRELPVTEISAYLAQVRQYTSAPLAMGFGISGPETVTAFRSSADAFVVGSLYAGLILQHQDDPRLPDLIYQRTQALKEAAAGAAGT